jgi:acyl-CoA hydrolase
MAAREMSADDAVALVRSHDAVGLGLITGTPTALMKALSRRNDWEDLTFSGGLIVWRYDVFLHPNVHYRSSFIGGAEPPYLASGADTQYAPSFFRHDGLLIQHLASRVMMSTASMPHANGHVSRSLYHGAHLEEYERAGRDPNRLLIVECSPHFPRNHALEGYVNHLDVANVDVVVTDEHPTIFPNEPGLPEEAKIADCAGVFIGDGATSPTGISTVPNLVAQALVEGDGGGYGVHSEMFTDGLYQLIAAGKVTNRRKNIHRGTSVITFAAGTQEMYDFIDDNPASGAAPVIYTNNPHVIAQNHRMVSINSALEVDLHGQIFADTPGARQYSGTSGHGAFVEGTSRSLEHTPLICLASSALVNGAQKSRVVSTITSHGVVTSPRHLAGVIVTEHGAADLRGKTVRERARAMIEIADPEIRDELAAGADLLGR